MDYKESRGWRNNNPLNIRRTTARWQGRRETVTDKAFEEFVTMAYGYRAAFKVLTSYYVSMKSHGQKFTIKNLISRWAPAADHNDTKAYIRHVADWSGIRDENKELQAPWTVRGRLDIIQIAGAMTRVECGIVDKDDVPWQDIEEGWQLAYGRSEK